MKLHFFLMRLRASIVITILFYAYAASDDSFNSWQPVQHNMRLRRGDYQSRISNEEECKTCCVATSFCLGVDWYTVMSLCFLFNDPDASPYPGDGYRHWRLIRDRYTRYSSQVTPAASVSVTSNVPTGSTDSDMRVTKEKHNDSRVVHNNKTAELYQLQLVQLNTRLRSGEFRPDLQNETACKEQCLLTSSCAGVFWYDRRNSCNFHTDCGATLFEENGFRYWPVQKYVPAASTCQNLVTRRPLHMPGELSVQCDSQNATSAVRALIVMLSASAVLIVALLLNTYRLNRHIQQLSFQIKGVQLHQQVQQQGHENNNHCTNPEVVYLEMDGRVSPMPSESENLYDDLDEVGRHRYMQ